jgi:hypothetical protein
MSDYAVPKELEDEILAEFRRGGEAPGKADVEETVDADTESAILAEWRGRQEKSAPEPTDEREARLAQRREAAGAGQTLQLGIPWTQHRLDTGLPLPQGATEFLAGMGRRTNEIVTLGMDGGDETANELLDDSGYATAGGVAADVLALGAGGTAAGGSRLAGAVNAVANPRTLAQAVVGGGAYGAATSEDRLSGAVGGAVGGGVGQGVVSAGAKVAKPAISAAARKLVKDGVPLTPGQMLGGRWQALEDKAMSAPLLGESIGAARGRGLQQYNRKIVNDALADIGQSVDERIAPGRDAIQAAQSKVSEGYSSVLEEMDVTLDDLFNDTVEELSKEVAARLPKSQRKAFELEVDEIRRAVSASDGVLTGAEFKKADSSLRQVYKRLLKSEDNKKARLGAKLKELHEGLLGLGRRQHPEKAEELARLDRAYAKLSVIEDAAGYDGAARNDGLVTPAMVWRATKKNTGRKALAGGKGFNQRETEAARDIMGQKVPDSGTAGRLLPWALGSGAVAVEPTIAAGLIGSAAAYSSPAQQVIRTLMLARPNGAGTLREILETAAPKTGRLGTSLGVNQS